MTHITKKLTHAQNPEDIFELSSPTNIWSQTYLGTARALFYDKYIQVKYTREIMLNVLNDCSACLIIDFVMAYLYQVAIQFSKLAT